MTDAEAAAYRAQCNAIKATMATQLAPRPGCPAPGHGWGGSWDARKCVESIRTLADLVIELLDEVKTKPH